MSTYFTPKSLDAQIEDVQQRLLNRQRIIDSRTTTLARKIQQQMIAPATLLLAGGIGFILGELTKCRRSANSDQPQASEISPLKIALNLLASARTLYPLLSLAWMMQSRYQQIPEQQTKATSTKKTRAKL